MARDEKHFTLREVERDTGISNAYLSQIESNKIKRPSPTILHKLAELYEVAYDDLLALAGYPSSTVSPEARSTGLAARIGPITRDEEDALAEYLQFLRRRRT